MNISSNEKKIKWELVFGLFLLMGIIFYVFKLKNKVENTIQKFQTKLIDERITVSNMEEAKLYILDSEKRMLKIDNSIPDNVSFILRLHDGICLSCYAENLIRLNQILEKDKDLKIFVLGSYNFTTQLKEELLSVGMKNVKYINIQERNILPADSIGIPYLFVLDNNKQTQLVYIFQKNDFKSINNYLSLIKRNNIKINKRFVR